MQVHNKHITNCLLLNASFIDNIGLMHGKMGIAIFFFHEARNTNSKIYQEYAEELIDEVYEAISTSTSIDFENGLAGIGWGIEYLVQNGFLDADTDEVLEEFDNSLFQQLIYQTPTQLGLLNGLLGIGFYLLKRLQNPRSDDESLQTLTNKQALIHLIDELDWRLHEQEIINLITCREEQSQTGCTVTMSSTQNTQTTIAKPVKFDITWDYAVLLWCLAEMREIDVFNYKVEQIVVRLIIPLLEGVRPPLKSQLLLIYLALEKLKVCFKEELLAVCRLITQLKKEIDTLTHTELEQELTPGDVCIKHGTSGIALVYKWLLEFTNDKRKLSVFSFWNGSNGGIPELDKSLAANKDKCFGILEGVSASVLLRMV